MGGIEPDIIGVYRAAAQSFAEQVRGIPRERFDGPGLGGWDLRALVGHTSRSLTTVIDYLDTTAAGIDIPDAEAYYRLAAEMAAAAGPGVLDRGRRAGAGLGADPAAAVDALVDEALAKLDGRDDESIAVLGGAGMRLFAYLPTRIFELTVHGFDIADATGLEFTPPPPALRTAATLGAGIAGGMGRGEAVLRALTGRTPLPTGFSVTA